MYSVTNFKSGKALREAVKASMANEGVTGLRVDDPGRGGIACYQPGPFGSDVKDGDHCCEGPHYPAAHRWYVRVKVVNGRIVKAYAR
jgi:hypothetical protein